MTSSTGARESALAMSPRDLSATGLPARAALTLAALIRASWARSAGAPSARHLLAEPAGVDNNAYGTTIRHRGLRPGTLPTLVP